MKMIRRIAGTAVLAITLTDTVQATPITGNISFTGNASLDTTSAGTATAVTTWSGTDVSAVSVGSTFAPYFLTVPAAALFNDSAVWKFNDPGTPIVNFWRAGGFSFELLSSHIVSQPAGYVDVAGTGIVSGNGFTPTTMTWTFDTQDPAKITGMWTFSASTGTLVPDTGSTVLLLGLALSGAAWLQRKLMA